MTVLAIDKSGSMAGGPMNRLKEQCHILGYAYFQNKKTPLLVLPYNEDCEERKTADLASFKGFIDGIKAEGQTNFAGPLNAVLREVKSGNVRSLLVYFLTDGEESIK